MESPNTIDFDFESAVRFSAAAAAHSAHSITTPSVTAAERRTKAAARARRDL